LACTAAAAASSAVAALEPITRKLTVKNKAVFDNYKK
jgi:hypothetical protein